jgi:hypothetical protein
MWPGPVVVVEALAQDLDQVALAQDDQSRHSRRREPSTRSQAALARGSAEPGSGDPDASGGEDRLEVGAVLRVAVAHQ